MKRYIFGLLAVVVASAGLAFTNKTSNNRPLATQSFYFVAPGGNDYSEGAVEDKDNWVSNPGTMPSCNGAARACRIDVNELYIQEVSPGIWEFNTSGDVAAIVAEEGSVEELYVPDINSSTGLDGKADRLQ